MKNLLLEVKNGIAYLTINRPEKLNALNFETLTEIETAFDLIESNKEVRGVIITGSGEKAFVAGADIGEFLTIPAEEGAGFAARGQAVFRKIETCSKPVIAAINGYALGGGCELALACHMRVLVDTAKLGQPEVNLGIVPGYGGTQRLTHLVGRGKALEWMVTADMISAEESLKWGLANYVVPHSVLISTCEDILEKVKSKPPIAVAEVINAVNGYFGEEGFKSEIKAFARCVSTTDFKEGSSAFIEKRAPKFKGE